MSVNFDSASSPEPKASREPYFRSSRKIRGVTNQRSAPARRAGLFRGRCGRPRLLERERMPRAREPRGELADRRSWRRSQFSDRSPSDEASAIRSDSAIIGHEPTIGELAARLTGSRHALSFKEGRGLAASTSETIPPARARRAALVRHAADLAGASEIGLTAQLSAQGSRESEIYRQFTLEGRRASTRSRPCSTSVCPRAEHVRHYSFRPLPRRGGKFAVRKTRRCSVSDYSRIGTASSAPASCRARSVDLSENGWRMLVDKPVARPTTVSICRPLRPACRASAYVHVHGSRSRPAGRSPTHARAGDRADTRDSCSEPNSGAARTRAA